MKNNVFEKRVCGNTFRRFIGIYWRECCVCAHTPLVLVDIIT